MGASMLANVDITEKVTRIITPSIPRLLRLRTLRNLPNLSTVVELLLFWVDILITDI